MYIRANWRHTLVVGEVPALELRLSSLEVLGSIGGLAVLLGHGEGELFVGLLSVGLAAVDGSVNLETDVEELASKEVGLVRREDASECRASSESLEGLGSSTEEARGNCRESEQSWSHDCC
jgi:hypothetical protein